MYKYIIFDVDGTLIDGTQGILSSLRKTIIHFNLYMPDKLILKKFIGPPLQTSCKHFLNLDDTTAQQFTDYFRQELIKKDIFNAKIYEGIIELLGYLKANKITLGIATYKRKDLVISLLKHFEIDKYYGSICGTEKDSKLTKTDIISRCIKELNAQMKDCLMIGDSYHDAEAANQLGIDFVGVLYGFGFKSNQEIQKYKPLFCANSVYDILEYFKRKY